MILVDKVDIMGNKRLVLWLNLLALLLFLLFCCLFSTFAFWLRPTRQLVFELDLKDLLLLIGAMLLILVIHELIHGLFFKWFKPENKIKFGIKWKSGMAYAISPGSLYSRRQMLVIGLAPFVFWTLVLSLLFAAHFISHPTYIGLVSLHAAGCTGDFYYVWLLLVKHGRGDILAEDTATGLLIYRPSEGRH